MHMDKEYQRRIKKQGLLDYFNELCGGWVVSMNWDYDSTHQL